MPGVVPAFLSGFTQTRAPGLSQTVVADLANAFVADLAETSVTDLVTRLAEAFVPAFVGDVAFALAASPTSIPCSTLLSNWPSVLTWFSILSSLSACSSCSSGACSRGCSW